MHWALLWLGSMARSTVGGAPALKGLRFQWKETDQEKAMNKTETWSNMTECDYGASEKVPWGR